MVYRTVFIIPRFKKIESIQNIRKKYDPNFSKISPHITLVFPFEDSKISNKELEAHIRKVCNKMQPFEISLSNIISYQKNVLLLVTDGNKIIRQIHDILYTGMLEKHLNKDIPYIPHLTLGSLESEAEAKKLTSSIRFNEEFRCMVDRIFVEHIEKNEISHIVMEIDL